MPTSWVKKAPNVQGMQRIDLTNTTTMRKVTALCKHQKLKPPSGFVRSHSFLRTPLRQVQEAGVDIDPQPLCGEHEQYAGLYRHFDRHRRVERQEALDDRRHRLAQEDDAETPEQMRVVRTGRADRVGAYFLAR